MNKKQQAGAKVVDAMDGLSNLEILEVLAASAVSFLNAGAVEMGLTGEAAAGFTQIGVAHFKGMVDGYAAVQH